MYNNYDDKNYDDKNNVNLKRRSYINVFVFLTALILILILCFALISKNANTNEGNSSGTGTSSNILDVGTTTNPNGSTASSALASDSGTTTTQYQTTTTVTAAQTTTKIETTATKAPTTEPTERRDYISDDLRDLEIKCDYFIGFDKTNNTVLYEKNADEKCYPASVTKVLTAIVALENMPLDYRVAVGNEIKMIAGDSSVAGVKAGQVFTLNDILYGLMLPSGNDVAYTVAVNVARYKYGSELSNEEAVSKFMDLCNDKAKKFGARNTHFSCPDGYHDDDHYTTVRDILKICVYAMENETLAEVVSSTYKKVTAVTGEVYTWYNTNKLINGGSSDYYKYCTGIKTGFTGEAKYCLAASAEKDGRELFAIAFHSSSASKRNNDVISFFKEAYSN